MYYDERTVAECFPPGAKFREDAERVILAATIHLGAWVPRTPVPPVHFKIGIAATPDGLAAIRQLSDVDARSIYGQTMADLCTAAERFKVNLNDALAGRPLSKVHPDYLPAPGARS